MTYKTTEARDAAGRWTDRGARDAVESEVAHTVKHGLRHVGEAQRALTKAKKHGKHSQIVKAQRDLAKAMAKAQRKEPKLDAKIRNETQQMPEGVGWFGLARLVGDDIDLVKHVATARGVRRYHKPIGSPIGGGGRSTQMVTLKKKALSFDAPAAARNPANDFLHQTAVTPSGPRNPVADFLHQTAPPRKPGPAFNTFATLKDTAPVTASKDLSDTPDMKAIRAIWDHALSPADKENLSSDLGLDPRLSALSIRELRKTIKGKKTESGEREAARAELHKRVAIQREVADAKGSWGSKLGDKLESAPEDADLAPIIGETLAAHPKLGPLAHIWDRLRLAGYTFRKHVTSKEAGDELPRIIVRTVSTVLISILLLHLGVAIPGLPGAMGGE